MHFINSSSNRITPTYLEEKINNIYPIKLEEEEGGSYQEIEKLKEKQKRIKEDLIRKKQSQEEKIKKDNSLV